MLGGYTYRGQDMGVIDKLLWRAFGLPAGFLGRIGGMIMAGGRQRQIAAHIAELIDVRRGDKVLEIGFGPGVGIEIMNERIFGKGLIAGIDPSEVMMQMARSRNAQAIENGTVTLISGTVENIPYGDGFFDKAYSMNSFQLWPDKAAGLKEVRRVLKRDAQLLLSFYGPARRRIVRASVLENLQQAGFREVLDEDDRDGVTYFIARK